MASRTPKVHLRDPDRPHLRGPWCGAFTRGPLFADDPLDATCVSCLRRLDADLDPNALHPGDRGRAISRAHGRASRRLREAHPDEWDGYYRDELTQALDEARRSDS